MDTKEDMIFRIYNKTDSIYFNEPETTDLLFKHMTIEQIKAVETEIDEMLKKEGVYSDSEGREIHIGDTVGIPTDKGIQPVVVSNLWEGDKVEVHPPLDEKTRFIVLAKNCFTCFMRDE